MSKLTIVILTGSGCRIVSPLLSSGIRISGLSENNKDVENVFSRLKYLLKKRINKKSIFANLSSLAKHHHIAYYSFDNIKDGNYEKWLSDLNPDLLILHQAPVLPREIFSIPRLGVINIHPSMLPKYRGSNPYFWLYVDYDLNPGVTLHYIDDNIDTGQIIWQKSYEITTGENYQDVSFNLIEKMAVPKLIEILKTLENNDRLPVYDQPSESPTPYARRVTDEEYLNVLNISERSLEHVWHILHSNEQWKQVFLKNNKNKKRYNWSLSGIEKVDLPPPYGVVDDENHSYFIRHPQGKIHLSRRHKLVSRLGMIFTF